MTAIRKYSKRGFTLVEILIVVIILGILAAIVIPQFTNASTEARQSNVRSQLQTLRSQIELYKLQHKDQPPKLITGDNNTAWSVFINKTDIDGNVGDTDGVHIYGPYMNSAPVNPLSGQPGVADDLGANIGWVYNEDDGKIYAVTDSTADCVKFEE